MKKKLRRLHPNIWVVTATSFLTDISSEMIVYLIPLFLSNILGVRTSIIDRADRGCGRVHRQPAQGLFWSALR